MKTQVYVNVKNKKMKKPLLTEAQIQRFQQLAGIKPLYEQEEDGQGAGEEDLSLNQIKNSVDGATDSIEDNIENIEANTDDKDDTSIAGKLKPLYDQVVTDLKEMDNTKEKKEKLQQSVLLSWKVIGTLSATPFILKLAGIGPEVVTQVTSQSWIWGETTKAVSSTGLMSGFLVVAALMAVFKFYLYVSKAYVDEQEGGIDAFMLDDVDDLIANAIDAAF